MSDPNPTYPLRANGTASRTTWNAVTAKIIPISSAEKSELSTSIFPATGPMSFSTHLKKLLPKFKLDVVAAPFLLINASN